MKKGILFVLSTLVFYGFSNAQIRFSASFSSSGDCNGSLGGRVMLGMAQGECDHYNNERTFTSCEECNQVRDMFLSGGGTNTQYGCTIHYYATPCMPCGGNGSGLESGESLGEANVLGLLEGTSFFSSNPANEVQDWAEDNEELLKILGGEKPVRHEFISDNGYVFSAHMPGTITQFINEDIAGSSSSSSSVGVAIPDEYLRGNKPFQSKDPWEWYSDDLNKLKIDMKPIDLSDLLADLARYEYEHNKDVFLGDVDDAANILKEISSLLMSSKVGVIPGALLDGVINILAEDVKATYLGVHGETIDGIDFILNALNRSAVEILGDWSSDVFSEGAVNLGATGAFGIPVVETHANAGITGANKVLSIGSIGSSINSIINRHSNNYDY